MARGVPELLTTKLRLASDMTEEEDGQEHVCAEEPVTAQKWCFWFLPGMIWNLFANWSRAFAGGVAGWVNFCEELGHSFYAHGLYKQERKVNKDVVNSFRDQLKVM